MMPAGDPYAERVDRGGRCADDVQVTGDYPFSPLDAAVAGDERAFALLYRDLQPSLLRYLRVAVGAEAEDVAADVWLEVARDIRQFKGDEARFRAWVFTIGRQRAIDQGRREARRPSVLVAEVPDQPTDDLTASAAVGALDTAAALALVRRLPRDQAEAVMLRVVIGFDVSDAARILGKRPGSIRVNTMRGLRNLAAMLDDESVATAPATPVR